MIGPAEDVETGALLVLEASQTVHTTGAREEPERNLRRALDIALATGDRALELDAHEWLAMVRSETEDVSSEWTRIHALAVRQGRWPTAVEALRHEAIGLTDDRAAAALPVLDRATELAEAHGLTEHLAWIDYERAEAGLVSGDWDGAIEVGLRAIDLGDRNAYHRVVVRTWFALLPILQQRDEREFLKRAARWFDEHRPPATAPWQLTMLAAAHLRLADAGLRAAEVPDPEPRLPVFSESQTRPSWFASSERVIRCWIDARRLEPARTAIEAVGASPRLPRLGRGVHDLLAARLAEAAAATAGAGEAAARRAARAFRAIAAPGWVLAALRELERAGSATADEAAEARRLESELGLPAAGAG